MHNVQTIIVIFSPNACGKMKSLSLARRAERGNIRYHKISYRRSQIEFQEKYVKVAT